MKILWKFSDRNSLESEGDLSRIGDLVYFPDYSERLVDSVKYRIKNSYTSLRRVKHDLSPLRVKDHDLSDEEISDTFINNIEKATGGYLNFSLVDIKSGTINTPEELKEFGWNLIEDKIEKDFNIFRNIWR